MSDHSSLMIHTVQIAMIVALLATGTLIVYYTGGTGFAYPYLLLLPVILTLITNGILRERLEWEVKHDHLTGLHNRRALIRRIERSL